MMVTCCLSQETKYQYFRAGNPQDVVTKTQFGIALMGGGKDFDDAFSWMCQKSGGGDFLVIRATGDDDYNPYIAKLCKQNSVATLVIPTREAAMDPKVAETLQKAEALFVSGGDQSNYVKYWKGTPVEGRYQRTYSPQRAGWRDQCRAGDSWAVFIYCDE